MKKAYEKSKESKGDEDGNDEKDGETITKGDKKSSTKKLKILIKNVFFTTDDKGFGEKFQCTKTSKCFALFTQLLKFEPSISNSEKRFFIFSFC